MAAYLCTLIYGNESFGGYLSVDGQRAIRIEDDMTYQLEPGPHRIEVFSTSNAERAAGRFQANVYNMTSSDGPLLDTIQRNQALKNMGDSWNIDTVVGDGQCLTLGIRSSGMKIVAAPAYEISDLSEEEIERLEEFFENLEKERLEKLHASRRSKPKIIWGIILIIGFAEALGIIPGMLKADSFDPVMLIPLAICLGLFGLGLWLFIDGVKKKVRVKK